MSLQRTLLISETDLQDFARYSQYIETKYTDAFIYDVQFRLIRPTLCNDLYSEIILALESSPPLPPGIDLLLNGDAVTFEGVKAWLSWEVYALWLREGNSKSTQTGLQRLASQFSEQAPDTEKNDLMQLADSRALFYKNEVISFLRKNKTDYPNWCDSDCGVLETQNNSKMGFVRGKNTFHKIKL